MQNLLVSYCFNFVKDLALVTKLSQQRKRYANQDHHDIRRPTMLNDSVFTVDDLATGVSMAVKVSTKSC